MKKAIVENKSNNWKHWDNKYLNILKQPILAPLEMEWFLGDMDNLRMIFFCNTPIQLIQVDGTSLCPKIGNNEVSANKSLPHCDA